MKRVSGKDLAKVLAKRGWVLVRTTGAHRRYAKQDFAPVTVFVHGTKILKPKTQQNIMRHTELTDADL